MNKTKETNKLEILGLTLLAINILVFLYFIFKLEQIESLAKNTQSQAKAIIKIINSNQ